MKNNNLITDNKIPHNLNRYRNSIHLLMRIKKSTQNLKILTIKIKYNLRSNIIHLKIQSFNSKFSRSHIYLHKLMQKHRLFKIIPLIINTFHNNIHKNKFQYGSHNNHSTTLSNSSNIKTILLKETELILSMEVRSQMLIQIQSSIQK